MTSKPAVNLRDLILALAARVPLYQLTEACEEADLYEITDCDSLRDVLPTQSEYAAAPFLLRAAEEALEHFDRYTEGLVLDCKDSLRLALSRARGPASDTEDSQ